MPHAQTASLRILQDATARDTTIIPSQDRAALKAWLGQGGQHDGASAQAVSFQLRAVEVLGEDKQVVDMSGVFDITPADHTRRVPRPIEPKEMITETIRAYQRYLAQALPDRTLEVEVMGYSVAATPASTPRRGPTP
jgi:hypothetical protein